MRVQNLTPHTIKIKPYADTNLVFSIHPSGLARVNMQYMKSDNLPITFGIADIPIEAVKSVPGEVIGLPEPEDNTIYIVSAMVAQAVPHRNDVYAPDTGSTAIRDDNGEILYVTRLIQYSNPYYEQVKSLEDNIEMRDRIEDNQRRRQAENDRLEEISREAEERERQDLIEKNMDLQDELDNKDHVWGTSRRSSW